MCPWCLGAAVGAVFGAVTEIAAVAMDPNVDLMSVEGAGRVLLSTGAGALAGGTGAGLGGLVTQQLAKTGAARAGMTAANSTVRATTRSAIRGAEGAVGGAVTGGVDATIEETGDAAFGTRDGEFNAEQVALQTTVGAGLGGAGGAVAPLAAGHARSVGRPEEAASLASQVVAAVEAVGGVGSSALEARAASCSEQGNGC